MPLPGALCSARAAAAALAALVVLSACGSTVQVHGTATLSGDTGSGLGSTGGVGTTGGAALGGSGASGTTGGAGLGSTGSTGLTGGTTGAGSTGGSSTTGTSGGTSGGGPASGHGWDAKHVYVGIVTSKDTQQVYASYGANNVDPGDTEAEARAVIADINAHGGVLGRTMVGVFKDLKTLDTATDPTGTGQTTCTYFTQDHPVVAVWNVNTQLDQVPAFRTCLAAGHVQLYTAAARAIDDDQLAKLRPYYFHTIMVSWDALAPVLVARLEAQGWAHGWDSLLGREDTSKPVKVGILTDSTPQGIHTGQVLKQAFTRGRLPALVYQYSDPSQGQASSVQYFNGNGVTHVVVTDVELTAFQNAAASQHYQPRYGITSYNDPYSNLEASGLTPGGANNGAMGVGWAPYLDVSDANDPGTTAGGRQCDAIYKAAKQGFSAKRLAHLYASSICDSLRLIAQGAAAGNGLTAQAIGAGIARIGPTFSPANGFAPALTASRPYVQGEVRDLAWVAGCSCFRYGATRTRL